MDVVLLWLDDLDDLVICGAHLWDRLRRHLLQIGLVAALLLALCELSVTALAWSTALAGVAASSFASVCGIVSMNGSGYSANTASYSARYESNTRRATRMRFDPIDVPEMLATPYAHNESVRPTSENTVQYAEFSVVGENVSEKLARR